MILQGEYLMKCTLGASENGIFVFLGRKSSLLPILTPSQGLKDCLFTMNLFASNHFYVNIMCIKLGGQLKNSQKLINKYVLHKPQSPRRHIMT